MRLVEGTAYLKSRSSTIWPLHWVMLLSRDGECPMAGGSYLAGETILLASTSQTLFTHFLQPSLR